MGTLTFASGVVLFAGNVSRALVTHPSAGYLTMSLGALILAVANRTRGADSTETR